MKKNNFEKNCIFKIVVLVGGFVKTMKKHYFQIY